MNIFNIKVEYRKRHTSSTDEFTAGEEDVADISNWNITEFSKYPLIKLNYEDILFNILGFRRKQTL